MPTPIRLAETSSSYDMATPVPDTTEGGRLHLLGLPVELQIMIFDFAYERPKNARLIIKWGWFKEHGLRKKKQKAAKPYPGTKVNEFLVSKQYFVLAARAYVCSQPYHLTGLVSTLPPVGGFISAFAKEVVADFICSRMLPLYNVRTLTMNLNLMSFLRMNGSFLRMDESVQLVDESKVLAILLRLLTAEELARSTLVKTISRIREVKKLEVVAKDLQDLGLDVSQEHQDIWRTNVETLEKVLQEQCSQPKTSGDASSFGSAIGNGELLPTPLYFGSQVSFEKPATKASGADNTKKPFEVKRELKRGGEEGRGYGWAVAVVWAVVILMLLTFLYVRVSGRVGLGGVVVRFESKDHRGKPTLRYW